MLKCPKCGSNKIYARYNFKFNLNVNDRYIINTADIEGDRTCYCNNCDWIGIYEKLRESDWVKIRGIEKLNGEFRKKLPKDIIEKEKIDLKNRRK